MRFCPSSSALPRTPRPQSSPRFLRPRLIPRLQVSAPASLVLAAALELPLLRRCHLGFTPACARASSAPTRLPRRADDQLARSGHTGAFGAHGRAGALLSASDQCRHADCHALPSSGNVATLAWCASMVRVVSASAASQVVPVPPRVCGRSAQLELCGGVRAGGLGIDREYAQSQPCPSLLERRTVSSRLDRRTGMRCRPRTDRARLRSRDTH